MTIFLWQWSSFITDTVFKKSMKVKKVSNLNLLHVPRWYMCPARNRRWIDTNRWTPLVQKKISTNWRCPLFRKLAKNLVLFSKIYYFYTYIWGSQGKWKTSGSLWTKKRKKEMMLNCFNLKCFKTKYQLVKCIAAILFEYEIITGIALLFVQHSYLL